MKVKEKILPQEFYLQDTVNVAVKLLGKKLVVYQGGIKTSGIIYETEAYLGLEDPACHSSHGQITARTKTFYLPGGHSYVYMIYGMYYCFNVVTGTESQPEAILIRAVWPMQGIESMRQRAPHIKNLDQLANGPGKLCRAFGIDKSLNERPLYMDDSSIFIAETQYSVDPHWLNCGPRIGIDYAGDAVHWPLRFWLEPQNLKELLQNDLPEKDEG